MASRRIGMFGVEPSESTDDRKEDGVAALLRRRREELERDVDTVARQLRIRAIYIRAIEEGRLQDLPGTAYAVGFVRAYADYLGLDGNSIVSDYRDELARRSRQNQLIWPVDQVEHKHFPGGIVLVVSLVLAVALYGGWYFVSQPGGTGIDLIDRVPDFMKKETAEETTEPVEGAVVAPAVTTTPTTAEAATPAPAVPSATDSSNTTAQAATEPALPAPTETPAASTLPATGTTLAPVSPTTEGAAATAGKIVTPPAATTSLIDPAATPIPGTTTTPATMVQPTAPAAAATTTAPALPPIDSNAAAPTAAAPTDTTQVAAAPVADAAPPTNRITLRAAKDSWVEIFDAEGKVVLQRILRAGETYAVPDQTGLVMNTGNAGGLVIELDGREQPSLGSVGVVKRDIKLEPGLISEQ